MRKRVISAQKKLLEKKVKDFPGEIQTLSKLGQKYLNEHRYDEAISILRKAVEAGDNTGNTWKYLGRVSR